MDPDWIGGHDKRQRSEIHNLGSEQNSQATWHSGKPASYSHLFQAPLTSRDFHGMRLGAPKVTLLCKKVSRCHVHQNNHKVGMEIPSEIPPSRLQHILPCQDELLWDDLTYTKYSCHHANLKLKYMV